MTTQTEYLPFLDELEKRAVEVVARCYDLSLEGDDDLTERFWAQKGIEGMRLAVAEAFLDDKVVFSDAERQG